MKITGEAVEAAENAYRETLTDLRLTEGGGFKVASQNRRALRAALEAAAPHMLARGWDEGVAYVFDGGAEVSDENPYRTTK